MLPGYKATSLTRQYSSIPRCRMQPRSPELATDVGNVCAAEAAAATVTVDRCQQVVSRTLWADCEIHQKTSSCTPSAETPQIGKADVLRRARAWLFWLHVPARPSQMILGGKRPRVQAQRGRVNGKPWSTCQNRRLWGMFCACQPFQLFVLRSVPFDCCI